ncbi:serine protease, S9A family peptidase [Acidovorax sp. CF316]|uniref:prolyl oligopeptidase family serine peptidase n=1 Tax=Acidovorax sp. CF316 TaxID=1144317 RepID=UPI00026BED88|nr:prolyl oligopeptidase family serine peptidase [Acidovorax sp. CF316]EJE54745.1 serine protease, S9A family peptidase [Acidovorax sp. CF316]
MDIKRRDLAAWPLGWGLLASGAAVHAQAVATDPHAWLEDVDSARALEWVNARNSEAMALIERQSHFARRRRDVLASLSNPANIQYPTRHGDHLYNFYRSARQPHGILRRTSLEEFSKERPSWRVLINFDDLARDESRNLVYTGMAVHAPTQRALIFLSSGGEDKVEMREFDLENRAFVAGGFNLPAAKMTAGWFGADEVLVAADFGPGTTTSSGYAMTARRWKRGTPVAAAPELLRGQASDVSVSVRSGGRDGLPPVALVRRSKQFHQTERHLLHLDGTLAKIDVPDDADAWIERDWLLVLLRTPWTTSGRTFSEGSLIAVALPQATEATRELHLLFAGEPRKRLAWTDAVRDGIVIASGEDMRPRLTFARWDGKAFALEPLPAPEAGVLHVRADQGAKDNRVWLTTQAPVTPQALALVDVSAPQSWPAPLKTQAEAFKADGMVVRQLQARSSDGTMVPYTVIGPAQPAADAPVLLYGYGGFGIALELDYQRMPGINWLQYGGVYVMAHIRGGGEFGPAWALAAKGAGRQRAFDDFIAVATDLAQRGIAQPARLGIYGASNGGALVTAVMVQRPELFGAVVSRVPLTDMLGFSRLFAGASWMEEYGDPDKPADRESLARWSPYQNAKPASEAVAYPPILFLGNRNDDRVHPAHARKMVAHLRALGHARVWLYEEIAGGHSGRTDPNIHARREALLYSFLFQQLAPKA